MEVVGYSPFEFAAVWRAAAPLRQNARGHTGRSCSSMESISSSNPLVQYKLLRQVGKGSYGKVYRALERSTNATLASQLVERVPHSVTAAPGFCEGLKRTYHRSAA